jgi:Dolichyl-phosphate-mannose-protein mannosyltransferase
VPAADSGRRRYVMARSAPAPSARLTQATGAGRPAWRHRPDWTLLVPPALTLAVMLWGITAPSYWRDETATLSAVSRSVPQLLAMLRHVDAVHGLYYLLLWPVTRAAGTREFVTRFPSAVAMTAADLGIVAIAGRLSCRRAALCAGLVFAILPEVSVQGHNARPYAMVTAAAVGASYLLLRAVAGGAARHAAGGIADQPDLQPSIRGFLPSRGGAAGRSRAGHPPPAGADRRPGPRRGPRPAHANWPSAARAAAAHSAPSPRSWRPTNGRGMRSSTPGPTSRRTTSPTRTGSASYVTSGSPGPPRQRAT